MTFIAALADKGAKVAAHRPWPRVEVDEEAWRQAVLGIAAGEATLFGLWSDGEAVHLALLAEHAAAPAGRHARLPRARFPSVAATPRARAAARAHHPRPVRPRAGRRAGPRPGSTMAAGACAIRSARHARPGRRRLRLPAGRGRRPAPDPRRPGARRHHRARPFPLHRQRRDGGAPGRAARLRAQGRRGR